MDKTEYRDFLIFPTGFYAHPDWHKTAFTYMHRDYDGDDDHRSGSAPSEDACKAEIDAWYEDNAPEAPSTQKE